VTPVASPAAPLVQAIDSRAIGARSTRWLLVLAALCAGAVIAMAVAVHHAGGPLVGDMRARAFVTGSLFGHAVMPLRVAHRYRVLVSAPSFITAIAGLVVVAVHVRDRVMVLVAIVAPAIALVLAEWVGKPLVGRLESGVASFPSGHATAVAAVATVAVLLAQRQLGSWSLAVTVPVHAVLTVGTVSAIVRVGSHLFSDAVAGALLGCGTVLGISGLADAGRQRWLVRPNTCGTHDAV
jgi:membrane-associated phospholipid phosphatase